jgi:hypothetical protein
MDSGATPRVTPLSFPFIILEQEACTQNRGPNVQLLDVFDPSRAELLESRPVAFPLGIPQLALPLVDGFTICSQLKL